MNQHKLHTCKGATPNTKDIYDALRSELVREKKPAYRLGRNQSRVILTWDGTKEVATVMFRKGCEELAQKVVDILNEEYYEQSKPGGIVRTITPDEPITRSNDWLYATVIILVLYLVMFIISSNSR